MAGNGLTPLDSRQPLSSRIPQDASGQGAPQTMHPLTAARSAATGARILVVEDDVPLARLLGSWLGTEGFVTELAYDGEEAAAKLASRMYQLVLLDLNLPKIDGMTLLERLHSEQPALPVLVLTGRARTEDRVLTLNQGADDCLVKPFSLVELLARIRALMRRRAGVASEVAALLPSGLTLNREQYRVERDGRKIELTPREFALLAFLMEHAPKPVSRATLMEEVWHIPFDPSTNIVDVYMKYLRDKIDCGDEPKLIRTVRGIGYALACA